MKCQFLRGITKEAREQLKKKPCGVCGGRAYYINPDGKRVEGKFWFVDEAQRGVCKREGRVEAILQRLDRNTGGIIRHYLRRYPKAWKTLAQD